MTGTAATLDEVPSLREENAALRAQIAWLKKKLFGPGQGETLERAQRLRQLGELEQLAGRAAERPTETIPCERPAGPAPKRTLPAESFAHLPVKAIVEIVPEAVRADPSGYEMIGEERTFELAVIPPQLSKREIVRPKFRHCLDRNRAPLLALAPKCAVAGGFASAGRIAWALTAKYCDHLPTSSAATPPSNPRSSIWKPSAIPPASSPPSPPTSTSSTSPARTAPAATSPRPISSPNAHPLSTPKSSSFLPSSPTPRWVRICLDLPSRLGEGERDRQTFREEIWVERQEAAAKAAAINLRNLGPRKSAPEKVLLAAGVKGIDRWINGWLSEQLQMGTPASASQFVRRFHPAGGGDGIRYKRALAQVRG